MRVRAMLPDCYTIRAQTRHEVGGIVYVAEGSCRPSVHHRQACDRSLGWPDAISELTTAVRVAAVVPPNPGMAATPAVTSARREARFRAAPLSQSHADQARVGCSCTGPCPAP